MKGNSTQLSPHQNGSAGQAQTFSVQTGTAAESLWFISNGNTNSCSHTLDPWILWSILAYSLKVNITRKAGLKSTKAKVTAPQTISTCGLKRAFLSSVDLMWLVFMLRRWYVK